MNTPSRQRRVFVSHSSKTPEAIAAREALVGALARMKIPGRGYVFEPMVDHGSIQPGDRWWRNTVNHWIAQCDAAVILLSQDASHSPYVRYEIRTLLERKKGYPDFPLVPLDLATPPGSDERETLLRAFQTVRAEPRTLLSLTAEPLHQAVNSVVEDLKDIPLAEPPSDTVYRDVEHLLHTVPGDALAEVGQRLDVDVRLWSMFPHLRDTLASRLMAAGERARTALAFLKPYCAATEIEQLLQLASSGWVSVFVGDRIRQEIMSGQPFIGFYLKEHSLVKLHLVRALGLGATFLIIPDRCGSSEDQFVIAIRSALQGEVEAENDAELRRYLKTSREVSRICVALSYSALSPELMDRLRAEFPEVTFLIMLDWQEKESDVSSRGISLIPATSDDDEESFWRLLALTCEEVRWER